MKTLKFIFVAALFCFSANVNSYADDKTMDLSGIWRFQLDPMGFGKTPGSELYLDKLVETIVLPGSTDESGKGIKNSARYVDRLSRKFEYQGLAWYQREVVIPDSWEGKVITMDLERCHWETDVYVDGEFCGSEERLSTPDHFDLTKSLTPGIHTITLCVSNVMKYPMDFWSHAVTEYTQTNWNGIVGKMFLTARDPFHIKHINVFPDVNKKQANVKVDVTGLNDGQEGHLLVKITEKGGKEICRKEISIQHADTTNTVELSLGDNIKLWDEFSPALYELTAAVRTEGQADEQSVTFGMRNVSQGKHHVQLNGHDIHLRGTLECAVFPLTGYPSTDVDEWKRIYSTIKSYGLNHVRFHSWCPPEAAFAAADEVGIYIQAELPMWFKDAGQYPDRRQFFEKEMYSVLDNYGNHPSFILMCNGNELGGDFGVLEEFVKMAQAYDNRRLYSASTARKHVQSDQFYTSHVTEKGGITVYEGKPSTDWDRNKNSEIDVPVIAHEAGQRCMYPNFNEIGKYTGVLEARNMEVFRERLTKNGMLQQADDFFKATGAHTVIQYKEVIESLLRSDHSGGFQMLGLSDFPGQGSAFVGILDAFWDSKGLVTPEKFRESCGPTVILARLAKRTYRPTETFTAGLALYNFSNEDKSGKLNWSLTTEEGSVLEQGSIKIKKAAKYEVNPLGTISFDIPDLADAHRLTLKAEIGTIRNEWDIWVYPEHAILKQGTPVAVVREWNETAKKYLEQGRNVLLIPENCPGRKTMFEGHFWNPIMFNWDPMIVGTLIDDAHPVFKDFPTGNFADWQWWDILNNSTAMELNGIEELTPIIQSIDSYETNSKLGIAFEANVGKGSLFVLAVDIDKEIGQRPATAQLLHSVINYMNSADFTPAVTLPYYKLDALFTDVQKNDSKQNDSAIKLLLNK